MSRKLDIRTSEPADAVMALHEADGWKPNAYPIELIGVDDIAVDAWNEPEPH
nr:hypothetical protein [Kibdelosporangium sp. MJ126-NF4]